MGANGHELLIGRRLKADHPFGSSMTFDHLGQLSDGHLGVLGLAKDRRQLVQQITSRIRRRGGDRNAAGDRVVGVGNRWNAGHGRVLRFLGDDWVGHRVLFGDGGQYIVEPLIMAVQLRALVGTAPLGKLLDGVQVGIEISVRLG